MLQGDGLDNNKVPTEQKGFRISNKVVLVGGIILGALLMLTILVVGGTMFVLSRGDNLEVVMIQNAWGQKERGDLAGAIETCNEIIEKNPSYANAYDSRARFNSALHKEEAAIKDFSKAIEYDPKNGEIYQARAYSLTQLGRYKEAKQDCEQAIKYGCNTPYVRELIQFCEHPQTTAPAAR